MKNEGGREAGKCSKVVPDRGDRCLLIFMKPSSFLQHISVSYSKAQLIGDWYENRRGRGARNTIIFLIISQYYWRTDAPFKTALSPHGKYGRRKFPLHLCTFSVSVLTLRFLFIRGAGNFGKGMEWEWGGGVLSTSNFYLDTLRPAFVQNSRN
jgi:hypothetical protein